MQKASWVIAALLCGAAATAQQFAEWPSSNFLPADTDPTQALALGDVDGDGDTDIVVGNLWAQSRLYLNDGTGTFTDATAGRLPVAVGPTKALALGDLDADGDLDLVVGNDDAQNRLLLNDGAGTFIDATAGRMPVFGDRTESLVLFDMEGDGDLDLVSGNYSGRNQLYENDGTAAFRNRTGDLMPFFRESTIAVAAGDVDRDGDVDLVIGNFIDDDRLYLNNGHGLFSDAPGALPQSSSGRTRSLALGDVDGDGDLDLALGNTVFDRLYENDGSGAFADVTTTRLPSPISETRSIATGDVDGDADVDIVSGSVQGQNHLYINDGTGHYTHAIEQMPTVHLFTYAIVLADTNGDGHPDIAEGNVGGQNRLLRNDGSGSFHDAEPSIPPIHSGTQALAAGDVDGDGDLDLALGNTRTQFATTSENTLLLNDGTGVLEPSAELLFGNGDTRAVALGDLDGDEDLDLVTGNHRAANLVYFNDGTGSFGPFTSAGILRPFFFDFTQALALADFDGDSDLDVFFGNGGGSGASHRHNQLYLNSGTGTFVTSTERLPFDSEDTSAALVGDFDSDGDLDIVCGNSSQSNRLYVNDGSAFFTDATAARLPADSDDTRGLAAGDVDGDGDLDLVIANAFTSNRLYLNDGRGNFANAPTQLPSDIDDTRSAALADVDLDGDLDVVFGNGGQQLARLYLNDGAGRFADATAPRLPGLLLTNRAILVTDLDRDGDLDIVLANDQQPNRVYVNRHRQLRASSFPARGESYNIELYATPGYGAAPTIGAPLLGFGLRPSPLEIPGLGNLFLAPPLFALGPVTIPQATGLTRVALPIPAGSAFVGLELDLQAAVVDDGGVGLTGYTTDRIR